MGTVHTYQIKILEHHLDAYGHVNHATYLQLCEEARWDWLNQLGLGLKYILKNQVGPVILEVNIKYKRELRLHETITLTSKFSALKGKLSQIDQIITVNHSLNNIVNNGELHVPDDQVSAEVHLTFGLMDLKQRRLIDLNSDWQKLLN